MKLHWESIRSSIDPSSSIRRYTVNQSDMFCGGPFENFWLYRNAKRRFDELAAERANAFIWLTDEWTRVRMADYNRGDERGLHLRAGMRTR